MDNFLWVRNKYILNFTCSGPNKNINSHYISLDITEFKLLTLDIYNSFLIKRLPPATPQTMTLYSSISVYKYVSVYVSK